MLFSILVKSQHYIPDDGFVYFGNDIVSRAQADVGTCQTYCDQDPNCVGFTVDKLSDSCWTKYAMENRQENDTKISYLKRFRPRPLNPPPRVNSPIYPTPTTLVMTQTTVTGHPQTPFPSPTPTASPTPLRNTPPQVTQYPAPTHPSNIIVAVPHPSPLATDSSSSLHLSSEDVKQPENALKRITSILPLKYLLTILGGFILLLIVIIIFLVRRRGTTKTADNDLESRPHSYSESKSRTLVDDDSLNPEKPRHSFHSQTTVAMSHNNF